MSLRLVKSSVAPSMFDILNYVENCFESYPARSMLYGIYTVIVIVTLLSKMHLINLFLNDDSEK